MTPESLREKYRAFNEAQNQTFGNDFRVRCVCFLNYGTPTIRIDYIIFENYRIDYKMAKSDDLATLDTITQSYIEEILNKYKENPLIVLFKSDSGYSDPSVYNVSTKEKLTAFVNKYYRNYKDYYNYFLTEEPIVKPLPENLETFSPRIQNEIKAEFQSAEREHKQWLENKSLRDLAKKQTKMMLMQKLGCFSSMVKKLIYSWI